jgi:uncharacterized protein YjbI with pentapeptide repeats
VRDEEHSLEEKDAHKGKRTPWTLREYGGKPVWDWLDLLIVPTVLLLITAGFTVLQEERQQRFEDQRADQALKIENQRAEAERKLAERRAQDEALQAYLSQMSSLLLERDLRTSEKGSEERTLARARTLTVLESLDPSRKRAVIQFLTEADLVLGLEEGVPLISSMFDLYRIGTFERRQPSITLDGANLSDADLYNTDLQGAQLSEANLSGADLRFAYLSYADLSYCNLVGADLSDAHLLFTNLNKADLSGADLRHADLSNAHLSLANLSGADLSDAWGVTKEQLSEAKSLKGATMPNGQKYEDWLKDKKAQGKDEKNK